MKSLAAVALLAFAPGLCAAPIPKEAKKEDKTEGTWQVASINAYGRQLVGANNQHWTLDAEGNMTSHIDPVAPEGAQKSIQLVFDKKAKSVDYKYGNGSGVYLGMYELSDDTLKLCCNIRGGDRPTSVEAGANNYIWTLKRVKPEEKK